MQLSGSRAFAIFSTMLVLFLDSDEDPENRKWTICYEYALMSLVAFYAMVMFFEVYHFSIN